MKSILQEDSSIAKAVAKAWQKAGEPKEFNVKVFSKEEKNFFGFVKKMAVVSLSYDFNVFSKSTNKSQPKAYINTDKSSVLPGNAQKFKDNKPVPAQAPYKKQQYQGEEKQNSNSSQNDSAAFAYGKWNNDLVKDVNNWITELVNLMNLKSTFTVSVNQHLLKIIFDKPVIENVNNERLLFSGFAFLLMQFLKRKYKRKFGGHRLAITSIRS
ncbi:TPA: hypothetical protein DEO28_02730 [Candidatus Dependentiae bacterium]|nr:MAG: hypothetical protein UR14_C0005G0100 [candidate division TM6 bacterium GW2011_GWE2_31_21]KKP53177.1 MAG: hypothetical protein UR43_C0007G0101 [candidate division TM6 bacterium GW2011_GWF2_33_332]HBS47995.1 hypothetical protein [Candidatus Dependentiae bacterium]HBZ73401.1 hypothetical protein [Candidatus Dependentiae bacterium]